MFTDSSGNDRTNDHRNEALRRAHFLRQNLTPEQPQQERFVARERMSALRAIRGQQNLQSPQQ